MQRRTTLLAHHYQESDIQELADAMGDSLELARKAHRVLWRHVYGLDGQGFEPVPNRDSARSRREGRSRFRLLRRAQALGPAIDLNFRLELCGAAF